MTAGRVGLEIELVAPSGLSRAFVATALALEFGGVVRFGLKHLSQAVSDDGQVVQCRELTPKLTVLDSSGKELLSLVDDFSIRAELDRSAPPRDFPVRLVMDEPRLAALVERRARPTAWTAEAVAAPLADYFDGTLGALGEGPRCHPTHRLVTDPLGQPLAVVAPYGEGRERVCEIVTRPLLPDERAAFLERVLTVVRGLKLEPALEGAVHVHVDAAPWKNTQRLKQLILDWTEGRDEALGFFSPNPRTPMWRGPFPDAVVDAAKTARAALPFEVFALALEQAGLSKRCDFNALGVIRRRHAQPTLEARFFSVTTDASALLEKIEQLELLLDEVSTRAG